MEKLEKITIGTAGLAQRIKEEREYLAKKDEKPLYIVQYNKLIKCGHNQY